MSDILFDFASLSLEDLEKIEMLKRKRGEMSKTLKEEREPADSAMEVEKEDDCEQKWGIVVGGTEEEEREKSRKMNANTQRLVEYLLEKGWDWKKDDLIFAARLIDANFFGNYFNKKVENEGWTFEAYMDRKLTRTVGVCVTWKRNKEWRIRLALKIYETAQKWFDKHGKDSFQITGGIRCKNVTELVVLDLQHEMLHGYIEVEFPEDNPPRKDPRRLGKKEEGRYDWNHGPEFMNRSKKWFNQTEATHNIVSPKDTLELSKIEPGSFVRVHISEFEDLPGIFDRYDETEKFAYVIIKKGEPPQKFNRLIVNLGDWKKNAIDQFPNNAEVEYVADDGSVARALVWWSNQPFEEVTLWTKDGQKVLPVERVRRVPDRDLLHTRFPDLSDVEFTDEEGNVKKGWVNSTNWLQNMIRINSDDVYVSIPADRVRRINKEKFKLGDVVHIKSGGKKVPAIFMNYSDDKEEVYVMKNPPRGRKTKLPVYEIERYYFPPEMVRFPKYSKVAFSGSIPSGKVIESVRELNILVVKTEVKGREEIHLVTPESARIIDDDDDEFEEYEEGEILRTMERKKARDVVFIRQTDDMKKVVIVKKPPFGDESTKLDAQVWRSKETKEIPGMMPGRSVKFTFEGSNEKRGGKIIDSSADLKIVTIRVPRAGVYMIYPEDVQVLLEVDDFVEVSEKKDEKYYGIVTKVYDGDKKIEVYNYKSRYYKNVEIGKVKLADRVLKPGFIVQFKNEKGETEHGTYFRFDKEKKKSIVRTSPEETIEISEKKLTPANPVHVEMEEWPREKEVSFNVNDKNYEGEVLMSNRTTGKVSVADTVDGGRFYVSEDAVTYEGEPELEFDTSKKYYYDNEGFYVYVLSEKSENGMIMVQDLNGNEFETDANNLSLRDDEDEEDSDEY